MANWSQFEDLNKNKPTECAVCEAMCPDAVDGTLTEAERRVFERHVAHCAGCAKEYEEAQRGAAWLGMLKGHTPEPPAALLAKILAETTGAEDARAIENPLPQATPALVVPVRELVLAWALELGTAEGGSKSRARDSEGYVPATDRDDGCDGVCFDCPDTEPDGRAAEEPAGRRLYAFGQRRKGRRGDGGAELPEPARGTRRSRGRAAAWRGCPLAQREDTNFTPQQNTPTQQPQTDGQEPPAPHKKGL